MSEGAATATTSETTSPVDAVANAVRGRKTPPTAEQRAEMARKAKNRRFAEKLKKAKTDAEAAALSREYQRSLGAEPDEPEPEAQPEPETKESVIARDLATVSEWPSEDQISARVKGATELWGTARTVLGETRYGKCLAPQQVEVPEEVGKDAAGTAIVEVRQRTYDPVIHHLVRPTAALLAKSGGDLGPGLTLLLGLGIVFGPTAARHAGELGAAFYFKMQARKQRAEPLAEKVAEPATLTVVGEPKAGTA